MKFSVIIPALNEAKGIAAVLEQLHALPVKPEIIVVDDGSTDDTGKVAAAVGATVVRHPASRGYGRSLKDGIAAATNDTIVISDADGTYPIAEIPRLLQIFNEGHDMVVGTRQGAAYRGSLFKMPARTIFKLLAEFTAGRRIPDINSGLRVFRRSDAMQYFGDLCNGFSFTTTITLVYMLTGKLVTYTPIPYAKRIGRSKVRIIRDALRTLQYLVETIVRYNPLKLFLLLSILVALSGVIGMQWLGIGGLFSGLWTAAIVFALGLVVEAVRRR